MRWLAICACGSCCARRLRDRRWARARPNSRRNGRRKTSVPQNYKQDLLAFLRTYLNDPTHVRGAAVSQPQLKNVGPGDRYVACVRYNARNSDGKYIGVERRRRDLRVGQARPLPRCAAGCAASFARTRPTRRFPNWKSSRASA